MLQLLMKAGAEIFRGSYEFVSVIENIICLYIQ